MPVMLPLGRPDKETKKHRWHTVIDDADYERVTAFKWHFHQDKVGSTNVYARREVRDPKTGKREIIYLHRFLLGVTDPDIFVDHDDTDGLNNQRYNLTEVDCRTNNKNRTHGLAANAKRMRMSS